MAVSISMECLEVLLLADRSFGFVHRIVISKSTKGIGGVVISDALEGG